MKSLAVDRIVMMEDHDKAYEAWHERGVTGHTLIHVDAHIDFGWIPETDIDEIRSLGEATLINPFLKSRKRMVTIGNYIYPAMRDGMVDVFYWVVPDPTWHSLRGRRTVARHLERLLSVKRHAGALGIERRRDGSLRCRVMGKEVIACSLETLPSLAGPVLLDIDTDYMLTPRIWDDLAPEREPWIYPDALHARLSAKVHAVDVLTVAYSVEGGYTPLRYKYLGDEIAARFGRATPENARLASAEYRASLAELRRPAGDHNAAARHYREALKLDKSYGTVFNNYGILYLRAGAASRSAAEFERFLRIDPENVSALCALGYLALDGRRYADAGAYFGRILARDARHVDARLGKGIVLARTAEGRAQARALFQELIAERPDEPEAHWWLGRLAERDRDVPAAIRHYQDAVMRGADEPIVHLRLAWLYCMKRMWLRMGEELRRAVAMVRL